MQYETSYNAKQPVADVCEDSAELRSRCDDLCARWGNILDTYVSVTGSGALNLPCDIRDRLLNLPRTSVLPHPSELSPAFKVIYELIEESVFPEFLSSHMLEKSLHQNSCTIGTKSISENSRYGALCNNVFTWELTLPYRWVA